MQGGVQGEDDTKHDQAGDDDGGRVDIEVESGGDTGGDDDECKRQPCGGATGGIGFAAHDDGSGSLYHAVADDPESHEAARLPEFPTEHG